MGSLPPNVTTPPSHHPHHQKSFHDDIGPFAEKYKTLVNEISSLYGEAKEKHAQGISVLIKDFAYHPAFKRWDDRFSSTPCKPA